VTVFALGKWKTNGEMIHRAVVPLGYLRQTWRTIDPTWGLGTWWTDWRPGDLVGSDLDAAKSPTGTSVDACNLPHPDESFDAVVIDGPYKLSGTPDIPDGRYGIHDYVSPPSRHGLIMAMMDEGCRVLRPGGVMLVKCQAQVSSGQVWWQPRIFAEHGERISLTHEDQFEFSSWRAQPTRTTCVGCGLKLMRRSDGRWGTLARSTPPTFDCTDGGPHEPGDPEQGHAARNYSSLLVLRK
jgi:hypothetical protein